MILVVVRGFCLNASERILLLWGRPMRGLENLQHPGCSLPRVERNETGLPRAPTGKQSDTGAMALW
jgi:hypothetical protein